MNAPDVGKSRLPQRIRNLRNRVTLHAVNDRFILLALPVGSVALADDAEAAARLPRIIHEFSENSNKFTVPSASGASRNGQSSDKFFRFLFKIA